MSLDLELLELDEICQGSKENKSDVSFDEYVFGGSTTHSYSKNAGLFSPGLVRDRSYGELGAATFTVAEIKSRKKPPTLRKSASEEFFYLTAAAAKMNSLYMDTICTVSTRDLFHKVLKENIPFHKVKDQAVAQLAGEETGGGLP